MRIERISDNQIRCTLSKRDLSERHLKISELAYGSERAKELFRDMMEQASIDFGFDADDIPLMIEAIPTSKESIILVITKVEDPEEFEEKFSKFGNMVNKFDESEEDDFYEEEPEDEPDFEDELINCFEQLNEIIAEADNSSSEFIPLHELLKKRKREKEVVQRQPRTSPSDVARVYSFSSLNFVVNASRAVVSVYNGKNSVWKDEESNRYYLVITKNGRKIPFEKICSILGEFGKKETLTYATQDYFNEHFKLVIKDDAIAKLSLL